MTINRAVLAGVLAASTVAASACRSTPTGTGPAGTAPVPTSAPATAPVTAPAPGTAPATSPRSPSAPAVPPAGPAAGPVTAAGTGWSPAGLQGPVPAAGSCTYRVAADGYYLPDPICTPGAVDPAVTATDLDRTICRRGGYTRSVRPPESLTERFKRVVEGAYRDPAPTSGTELDHLVPLGLGGASDTRNLWPEPDQGRPARFDPQDPFGINAKDGVEDRLHTAVCDGLVPPAAAQQAVAADWTTALARLGVTP